MKTTVIYHRADFDGIFCREIARKFLPEAELIDWDFADKPIPVPTEGKIYVLDLPVDRIFGWLFKDVDGRKQLMGTEQPLDRIDWSNFVWIDHHKSSIETHTTSIPGYRIDGVAACRLAWQWFTELVTDHMAKGALLPEKQAFIDRKVSEPLAVRLAGEYDIWDHEPSNNEDIVFQFGLRRREVSETMWELLLFPQQEQDGKKDFGTITTEAILEEGRPLWEYQKEVDAGTIRRSFLKEFEGLKFLCLNTARCNSLTFAAKDVPETGHDALMGFYWNGKWNVSLYHAKHRTDIDLSTIAVKYDGGGHRGACGFQVEKLPFVP